MLMLDLWHLWTKYANTQHFAPPTSSGTPTTPHSKSAWDVWLKPSAYSLANMQDPTTLSLFFFGTYTTLHLLLHHLFRSHLIPASQWNRTLQLHERAYLPGKLCSSLNGLLLGVCGLWATLHPHSDFRTSSLHWSIFTYYPAYLHLVFSSYVGYTIYDLGLMLWIQHHPHNTTAFREHWSMFAHHLIGGLGAYLTMLYRQATYFPMVFLITELSVVPVNWIWTMRTLGLDGSHGRLYKRVLALRTVMFLMFRTGVAPACLWHTLELARQESQRQKRESMGEVGASVWRVLVEQVDQVPRIVVLGSVMNVFALGGLNLWWTILAARSMFRKRVPTHGDQKKD